jgi:AcrR family transcriptional regulator
VAAITTRKLAGEAAVNLATPHALFGSKDALLVAVLEQVTGRMIEALAPPARAHRGLRAALAESSAALWALTDREPRLPVVRCELLLYLLRRPAHAEAARVQQRRYLAALADLYRRCRASTDGRIASPTLAQLVASQVDGLALHNAFREPGNPPRQIRAHAHRTVLALLEEAVPATGGMPGSGNGTHRGTVRGHRSVARGDAPAVDSPR